MANPELTGIRGGAAVLRSNTHTVGLLRRETGPTNNRLTSTSMYCIAPASQGPPSIYKHSRVPQPATYVPYTYYRR